MNGSDSDGEDTTLDAYFLDDSMEEDDATVMAAMPLDHRVGTCLDGRYEVLRIIGEGGAATVYEAVDLVGGERVAVKVLTVPSGAAELATRFQKEIEIGTRLSSPFVTQVFSSGQLVDGRPYLVEELLLGVSLSELLESGPVSLERALGIIDHVLLGLDAAHQQGIVHRDLKPENVFVANPGTVQESAKILDFGFAMELSEIDRRLTRAGTAVGTPTYMSPEQFLQGEISPGSDLYAAGTVLYEMLRGRPPFHADDPASERVQRLPRETRVGWMHINNEPAPIAGLHPRAWVLVATLLAKDPDDRYADVAAACAVIKRLSDPEPEPVPEPERAQEPAPAPAPEPEQLVEEPDEPPTMPISAYKPPPKKASAWEWVALVALLAVLAAALVFGLQ